jgi:two-component system response regulator YesN
MLKVLIVDDEFLARVGLLTLIDWNYHGYEIVGELENGQQALEYVLASPPDIVISDIQMPIMNGIELIQAVRKANLDCKFVMLSSYDDFSLVKGALKAGAEDYVLKLQMEEEGLLAVLEEIRQKIVVEQQVHASENIQQQAYNRDRDVLRQVFLRDLFNGKVLSNKEIKNQLQQYNMRFYPENIVTIAFRLAPHDQEQRQTSEPFRQLLKRNLVHLDASQLIEFEDGYFVGLCSFGHKYSQTKIETMIAQLCNAILDGARNALNMNMTIGVSSLHQGAALLRQCYLESMYVISQSRENTYGPHIYYRNIREINEAPWVQSLDKHISAVAMGLEENDVSQIEYGFSALIKTLEHSATLPTELVMGNSYVLNYLVQDFVNRHHLKESQEWTEIQQCWNESARTKGLHQTISWIGLLKKMVCQIVQQQTDSHSIILRAKKYIQEHLAEPISLTDISHHLGLSSSYFSRLFSQESGERFVDYVRQQKIEHAQSLIRGSNKKMYEIAEALGYENVHYFSRVFKKTVGISPMDYKHGKR